MKLGVYLLWSPSGNDLAMTRELLRVVLVAQKYSTKCTVHTLQVRIAIGEVKM